MMMIHHMCHFETCAAMNIMKYLHPCDFCFLLYIYLSLSLSLSPIIVLIQSAKVVEDENLIEFGVPLDAI